MELAELRELLKRAEWRHKFGPGTDYYVWDVSDRFPNKARAFFLRLAPGGKVHPHVDTCRARTTHFCVESNARCVMVFGGVEIRLQPGESCNVDRSVEHWSRNDGDTDRVHLLVEEFE
jgi:oxalate decarboxylase/phosphoglucose isomerase-like protein (cupin superfamily)